jgi:hypothetical protein
MGTTIKWCNAEARKEDNERVACASNGGARGNMRGNATAVVW